MNEIATVFATAYRSQRLIYRAIENTDADKEVMHRLGCANLVNWGLMTPRLFKHVSKKENIDSLGDLLDSPHLLKVLICLPGEDVDEEDSKRGPGARAARERETAIPIGSLTLSGLKGAFSHAQTTVVGLNIGEEFQNKGYGGEAISWAVDWAFRFANVHRVEIATSSFNERAAHLYEKLGFTLEGRKRECIFVDRRYYDDLTFGMLESEWKRLRGRE